VHHDRRIPIPGFSEYGLSNFDSTSCPNLIEEFKFKTGVCTSSDSLDHSPKDDELMLASGAVAKEMEAASIAWVASFSKTPFFALKVVTDLVDGEHPTEEEFLRNLAQASEVLKERMIQVATFLKEKKISQI
jgi:5'-methylthioadenosine nucleosidase